MKKIRNVLNLVVAMSMLCMLSVNVGAVSLEPISLTESFNEYDYIQVIQESSPQELNAMGLSVQEAEKVIENFENSLLERASLPDEELRAYGYDSNEIRLLNQYAAGQPLSHAELRALGSTCQGKITRHSCNTTTAEFSYTFTWDRCPIVMLNDSAAMRWIAYDDEGDEIGVSQTSYSMVVEYYYSPGSSGVSSSTLAHKSMGTNEPSLDFNTLNMQFPVYEAHAAGNGIVFDCYAKTGTVKVAVRVPNGNNQKIHHIFVGGLYGHTLVGVGSPSVSVGGDSISISFTGNTSIDAIASRKATIYYNSSTVEYWD